MLSAPQTRNLDAVLSSYFSQKPRSPSRPLVYLLSSPLAAISVPLTLLRTPRAVPGGRLLPSGWSSCLQPGPSGLITSVPWFRPAKARPAPRGGACAAECDPVFISTCFLPQPHPAPLPLCARSSPDACSVPPLVSTRMGRGPLTSAVCAVPPASPNGSSRPPRADSFLYVVQARACRARSKDTCGWVSCFAFCVPTF